MIAQMNFATTLAPLDTELMAEFTDNLDKINALAEASDGFVWRLKDESGNATSIEILTDPKAVLNVTVWRSVQDLFRFTYQSDHSYFVRHAARWFVPTSKRSMVLWNLADNASMPTPEEAFERLRHLEKEGPSEFAFDFKSASKFTS